MLQAKMNVCQQSEEDFFLQHLKPHHKVLEWGSGASTLFIAKHVQHLVSIEHNRQWADNVMAQKPDNVTLFFVPPHQEPEGGDDGTMQQFNDYVHKPLDYVNEMNEKFDVIFIDGRARVACASICAQLGHPGTIVFIHDYDHPKPQYKRPEYLEALKYLTHLGQDFTMAKFNITALQPDPVILGGTCTKCGQRTTMPGNEVCDLCLLPNQPSHDPDNPNNDLLP